MDAGKKNIRAVKRLRNDYEDLLNSSTQIPYLAAAPSAVVNGCDDSLKDWLKWKVCVMGPPSSRFAGILLSLNLQFPYNYPEKGPRAELVNGVRFRHGHVYGNWICLSILNDFIPCWGKLLFVEKGGVMGIVSSPSLYSYRGNIMSLCFLFDEDPEDGASILERDIMETFRDCVNFSNCTTNHTFINPVPRPPAWDMYKDFLATLDMKNVDHKAIRDYFLQGYIANIPSHSPRLLKSVQLFEETDTSRNTILSPQSAEMQTEKSQKDQDQLFKSPNIGIDCEVVEIRKDMGAYLSSRDGKLFLPKGEIMKVKWEGNDMQLVFSVEVGERVKVYKCSSDKRSNRVSLNPPRVKTFSRDKQTQLIEKVGASHLMHAHVVAGTASVIKTLPNGLLVALGALQTPKQSSSSSNSSSKVPAGLVALLPDSALPPQESSMSRQCDLEGKLVFGKGLWVSHVSSSTGRLEVTALDPTVLKDVPLSYEVGSKIIGRVQKIVTPYNHETSTEYALIQLSHSHQDVQGKLCLSTVQRQLKKTVGHVWELKQVGIILKQEVNVIVIGERIKSNDNTIEVGLDLPDSGEHDTAPVDHPPIEAIKSNKKKQLMDLTDWNLLDILSFLSRADLAALSCSKTFTYGKKGGMKRTPAQVNSFNGVIHPRLSKLADASSIQRSCSTDFSCVFLRESFHDHVIGVGVCVRTHQERHEAERHARVAINKRTIPLDFDGEPLYYDEWYPEEHDGKKENEKYTLNAWLTSRMDVVARASAWAAEQRAAASSRMEEVKTSQHARYFNIPPTNVEEVKVFWGCGYFSYEAYHIHHVKTTPMHAPCSTWLPLWINNRHGKKASSYALKSAVTALHGAACPVLAHANLFKNPSSAQALTPCMMMPNSGDMRGFILNAFVTFVLKAMNTTVVGMLSGATHDSEAALEGYFALYQLLINVGTLHQGVIDVLKLRVVNFVNDASSRNKKQCASLGELLPLLPLCGLPWNEVVVPIVTEAFTRNARWALKAHPNLADLSQDVPLFSCSTDELSDKEKYRLKRTLEANAVSLRLIAFHCVTADILISDAGSEVQTQILRLDLAMGKPSTKAINKLKLQTRGLKSLSSWDVFFDAVKLPQPSSSYLVGWLRRSIELSSIKGYHNQHRALSQLKHNKIDKIMMKTFKENQKREKSKHDHYLDDL